MTEEEYSASSGHIFRGFDYLVSMHVRDGNNVIIEVEDRVTSDQWRANFDSAYIESLTHKTGNFKQFDIFINMLKSSIIKSSDSVSLDFLTYADLENLRQRKSGMAKSSIPANRSNASNSKCYLILTYTVEFDRIHYPLPLPYMGKPDPKLLQESIQQLRAEIKILKQQGTSDYRSREYEKLKRDHNNLTKEKEDIEAEFVLFRREMKSTTTGNAVKEIRMLKNVVRNLEEELMKEKTRYQRSASKRSQEYRDLLEEVEELRASERNQRVRVKSLINELAMYKRDRTKLSQRQSRPFSRERQTSFDRMSSRDRSESRERTFSRDNSLTRDRRPSRERSDNRGRPNSAPTNRSRLSDISQSSNRNSFFRLRSISPSPAGARTPRFDPSAYIKEKDRRKKESVLKQHRRHKANTSGASEKSKPSPGNRINASQQSSRSRNRIRTSSYDSQAEYSDGGVLSDSSYTGLRNYNRPVRPPRRKPAYLSSPDVSRKEERNNSNRKKKMLASTPDSQYGKTRSRTNKENYPQNGEGNDSDYFDRSAEISEIDARLNRLQQMMKTSIS